MKMSEIEVNNRNEKVFSQRIKDKIWFHLNGKTYVLNARKTSSSRRASGPQSVTSPGEVRAPMPGKIIKVHVSVGDSVRSGQTLIVMEAMKMEYYLKSDQEGKIEQLNCNEQDQVTLGALLVKVNENIG